MITRTASRALLFSGITALLVAVAAPAMATQAGAHIRGTISNVTANGFTVNTATGSEQVAISDSTKIVGVVPSSLDQVKDGTYIGTANVPQGNSSRALELVVFPDSMKGAGLGNYPWDLSAQGGQSSSMSHSSMTNGTVTKTGSRMGGSSMTNGTVTETGSRMGGSSMTNGTVTKTASRMGGSSMTNGTVTNSNGKHGMTLTVNYGKGSKTIQVPADVPVVTFQPAQKSAIVTGAHVFVAGKPGNPVQAGMVAVGLNGTVPPM